jgi:hypothetical protein
MWCTVLVFACRDWGESRMAAGSLICRPRCWWREIRPLDRRWATCRKDYTGRFVCTAIGYKAHRLWVWTIIRWNSGDLNTFTRIFKKFCCLLTFVDHLTLLKIRLDGPTWIVDLTYLSPFGEQWEPFSIWKDDFLSSGGPWALSYSTFGHLCTCWLECEHNLFGLWPLIWESAVVCFRIAPVPLVVTVNCLSHDC